MATPATPTTTPTRTGMSAGIWLLRRYCAGRYLPCRYNLNAISRAPVDDSMRSSRSVRRVRSRATVRFATTALRRAATTAIAANARQKLCMRRAAKCRRVHARCSSA